MPWLMVLLHQCFDAPMLFKHVAQHRHCFAAKPSATDFRDRADMHFCATDHRYSTAHVKQLPPLQLLLKLSSGERGRPIT